VVGPDGFSSDQNRVGAALFDIGKSRPEFLDCGRRLLPLLGQGVIEGNLCCCRRIVLHRFSVNEEKFLGHHNGILAVDAKYDFDADVSQSGCDTFWNLTQRLVGKRPKMKAELSALRKNLGSSH